jgi:LysR family transcriptional regulator, transcriptional activator for dmlA
MSSAANPDELAFFSTLGGSSSLSAAARDLGVSTAAVSKRLALMEHRLGVSLIRRTTRRMNLTPEGDLYLLHARRILAELNDMEQLVSGSRGAPKGLLRVNATLGFGRSHVAPLISRFVRKHPAVEVQLQLSVNPPPLSDDSFDVCIRFGEPPEARVIARRIAANRRLLVAAPAYLERHGSPATPRDLTHHNCIGIRQGDEAYGLWRLAPTRSTGRAVTEAIKTRGSLTTNDGEIAVNWALDGHGILMRAEWDVARYLRSGRLVQVLPGWQTPAADIHAVYPQHHQTSARVRAFVDFIADKLIHADPADTQR